jgi:hypothetical protein
LAADYRRILLAHTEESTISEAAVLADIPNR